MELFAALGQGCAACDRAVETQREGLEGHLCLRCRQDLPPGLARSAREIPFVDTVHSLGPYSGLLGGLVRSAKYEGRRDLLADLGVELARGAADLDWPALAGIAAVPTTPWRLLARGFDPVAHLAIPLEGVVHAPVLPVLLRERGPRQARRTHAERQANVLGRFRARRRVHGAWLLVDDVVTTGATVSACGLALREAGASAVHVVAVAG